MSKRRNLVKKIVDTKTVEESKKINKEKKEVSNTGYFQYSYQRIVEIACNPDLGLHGVLSYLVLAGGVNGEDASNPRASRHWKRSVYKRTGLSEALAELAIEKLVSHGYIEKLEKENPNDMFYYTCRVDPKYDTELSCLSQKIFDSADVCTYKGSIGSLRHFCKRISIKKRGITIEQQRLDAIMLFLALHEHQDFLRFSGIDPKVVNSQFGDVDPGFLDDWPSCLPVPGAADWTLNHVKANLEEKFWSEKFLKNIFSCLPEFDSEISIKYRVKLAVENLVKADLLYSAHVLWSDNPIQKHSHARAKPLYVVYVNNSKSPTFEISLHESIKKTSIETNTLEATQIYGNGKKDEYLYVDDHFGYMVDGADAETAVMFTIYRARWWASDPKTMQSIQACSDRTQEAEITLESLVELALSGEYFNEN
jgi:hypothetical protein